jgi:hypothetical protein
MKQRIKINIIKQIKDISLFDINVSDITIHNVINYICPSLFVDIDNAKYFLHIIGDCILKKKENLIYILSPNAKYICKEILSLAYNLLGITHIFNTIKYKYYDHNYADCRLIQINNLSYEISKKLQLNKDFYKYILDFLCVACYFSKLNQNADTFLYNINNKSIINHALYLKTNNIENIIDKFIDKTLEKCNNSQINWKNILFLNTPRIPASLLILFEKIAFFICSKNLFTCSLCLEEVVL